MPDGPVGLSRHTPQRPRSVDRRARRDGDGLIALLPPPQPSPPRRSPQDYAGSPDALGPRSGPLAETGGGPFEDSLVACLDQPSRFEGHEHFNATCPAHRCPGSGRQPVGAGATRGLRPPDGGRQGHRPTGAEVGGRGALRPDRVLRRRGDRVVLGIRRDRALWVSAADRGAQLRLGASQRGPDGADLSAGAGGRGETHRGGQHEPGLQVVRATVVRRPDRPSGAG